MALSYLVWPKAKRKKKANKNKIGEHKKHRKATRVEGKTPKKIGLVYLVRPTFVRQ